MYNFTRYRSKYFDGLTHIKNNHHLFLCKSNEFRHEITKKTVCIHFKINNFNEMNKIYGYLQGDKILKNFTKNIIYVFGYKSCYRVGSSKFTLKIEEDNKQIIYSKIEKLLELISNYKIKYSIVIGVAFTSDYAEMPNISDLSQKAEISRHEHSTQTNNSSWVTAKENNIQKFLDQYKVMFEFHHALKNDYIQAFFQPKVDHFVNKIVGAEALARWIEPTKIIYPDKFISVLEKENQIHLIDWRIAELAIKFVSDSLKNNLIDENFTISFNLSPATFDATDVIAKLTYLLNLYEVSPKFIDIEITENTVSSNYNQLKETINNLHNMGINISLDDFSTGFSSVKMLSDLKIDTVKMDRSLIVSVEENQVNAKKIYGHLTYLIKDLGKNIVAEGVENLDTIKFLKFIGISIVQGYAYSKPINLDDFNKLVKQMNH